MAIASNRRGRLLSEDIFFELEKRVINRIYPPGAHLIEDEIAESLGVSRTPVREAFRALQRAGWVEIHPHSGAYVRQTTFEEVRDLFELRQWLEERAVRVAVERITASQIRELQKILERGHRAVKRGNGNRSVAALNSAFHERLAAASANKVLAEMLKMITKQVHWHFTAVAEVRGSDSWSEHDAILQAIVGRDADEAAQLMIEHSRRTQDAFLRHLSTYTERPAET